MKRSSIIPVFCALLGLVSAVAQTPKSAKKPTQNETFTQEVLELQGVWSMDESSGGPAMARLIVHGGYFLLIYQWPNKNSKVYEIHGFQANGGKICDRDGQPVLNYIVNSERSVNFEVLDESPRPASKYCEFGLIRSGKLPDLQLPRSSQQSSK